MEIIMHSYRIIFVVTVYIFSAQLLADECSSIHVGKSGDWFPIVYQNTNTQTAEGIAIDVFTLIEQHLGIPVEVDDELPWLRVLKKLQNGSLDMVTGLYWTSTRDNFLHYTNPYFKNEARIFVVTGNQFDFRTAADLQDKVGGLPNGGSFGEQFDNSIKKYSLPIERVDNKKQLVGKLLTGRNDYFIEDFYDGMTFIKQSNLEQKIIALPTPVSETDVHMGISKLSPCSKHLESINELITQIKQDGQLERIIEKHVQPL